MTRVLAVIAICFALQGCATITAVTLGTAAIIGVASGVGRFAGENIARHQWQRHIAWKRCQHFRHDHPRLERCIRRYVNVARMVREDERRWNMNTR